MIEALADQFAGGEQHTRSSRRECFVVKLAANRVVPQQFQRGI